MARLDHGGTGTARRSDGVAMPSDPHTSERLRLRAAGLVQGVGFRPHVWRTATALGLGGFVRNDAGGVVIEVEGRNPAAFAETLLKSLPPRARLDRLEVDRCPPRGETEFRIADSTEGVVRTGIGPDTAVCANCLAELFDPNDRRYRHAFITCTDCGPRFTIAHSLPYDRARTSLAPFPLCSDCARDYRDPASRRFHAEPICCPNCGPRLEASPGEILEAIEAGGIVAVQGLGGFQLLCNARNARAIARLRARKRRDAKPFAVMVANLASARALADCPAEAAALLTSAERPIVLLRARPDALPAGIAPGLADLGVMLPATPLHYLLFHEAAGRPAGTAWLNEPQPLVLVATSGNLSGEPIAIEPDEARRRLAAIADLVIGHDRAILSRADDSVARIVAGAPMLLRRARGYVPEPIALAEEMPPVLAVGAHLKVTACLLRGREAFLSQHVGDLDTGAAIKFLEEAIHRLQSLLEIEPIAVAHDLHPDYASTRLAASLGLRTVAVQHHHAHLASVAAEHGITGPLFGFVLDGYGYGPAGEAWGGELLHLEGCGFNRLGGLASLPLPGGDRAAREPWRMAAAVLHRLGRSDDIAERFPTEPQAPALAAGLAAGHFGTTTSSAGRLFDAAAALLGLCRRNGYEGEGAMRLEGLVRRPQILAGGWHCDGGVLDLSPLFAVLADLDDPVAGAELFHGTLAAALADFALPFLATSEPRRLALTGGCAANRVLAETLGERLAEAKVELLLPRRAPPGDGGISLGQALIAGRILREEG